MFSQGKVTPEGDQRISVRGEYKVKTTVLLLEEPDDRSMYSLDIAVAKISPDYRNQYISWQYKSPIIPASNKSLR